MAAHSNLARCLALLVVSILSNLAHASDADRDNDTLSLLAKPDGSIVKFRNRRHDPGTVDDESLRPDREAAGPSQMALTNLAHLNEGVHQFILAKTDGDDISRSRDAIRHASNRSGFKGFPQDCPVVFDIGTNDGADAEFYLEQGYCVVSVDANPLMIVKAKEKLRRFGARAQLFSMGLDETLGNLTFYVTKSTIHSSFDKKKALSRDKHPMEISVPTVRCEALWALTDRRPYYVKIDIEERHFVCVEAISRLPPVQMPQYVSWEMHEYARGMKFPSLDMQLITKLALNYPQMKIASNIFAEGKDGGAFSGGFLPEGATNFVTGGKDWVNTSVQLRNGIPCARCHNGDWWDYHMKLGKLSDS
eukprot:gnl/TRDRNA2_/TRDRNA2_185894_c0_seq1.p1 gnl/TRDRNA2_/TRDRNA2_185894_c0~~gnl/TRDRNA2_/TRDRNA2_185894_c0_seq1.p1  ORF type:complete len:362 (+),score=35.75 gnl/TRDRNA2_/TRDRNA2_185894_c0_seq1:74-1159(+)